MQSSRLPATSGAANTVSDPAELGELGAAGGEHIRHADQGLKSALVMMVDDEPINMAVVQTYLEDAGYKNFRVTSDSAEAIGILEREHPDCLLLDLVMPGVTGFDILTEMRSHRELARIPVVVLTSSDDSETKLKALELGATDFLSKPVDSSELVLRVRNTLAAKAYQDHLRYYDGLTGLPNRQLLLTKMQIAVDACSEGDLALMHIALDRFKSVNDTLGHSSGDELLKRVAERLLTIVGELSVRTFGPVSGRPVLARLGGDEFGLLLPAADGRGDAQWMADELLRELRLPIRLQEHEVFVTPSIGLAVYPRDASSSDELLARAGIAMSAAKAQSGNRMLAFTQELHENSIEQLHFEAELRRALGREQLLLHYQPKVDMATGTITGMEALLRWVHPEFGMVPPGRFISLAEDTGIIVEMGEWILAEACLQCRRWEDAGLSLRMSINLSSKQFSEQGLLPAIHRAVEQSGVTPGLIVLEVTESMLMGDAERAIDMMHNLRAQGMRISIDDFGTGYSSFGYLKRFPLDELKIDRSFVMDLEKDSSDVAIVSAITAMAHALDLEVVAEGVETEGQRQILQDQGCDIYQGFLFSKPMPADELNQGVLAQQRVA